jgi:ribonuclease HI
LLPTLRQQAAHDQYLTIKPELFNCTRRDYLSDYLLTMSGIPVKKPMIAYDARRFPVCFDHRLPLCVICCVDYRGLGQREEDEQDSERVFILGTGVNRFVPQWDEQLLGPANTREIEKNYDNPPKALTPDQLSLHYCGECQLTWLKGNEGVEAVQSHPSHHTYQHIYAGTSRSLIVFTDGACPSNGTTLATKASVGVYFGSESRFNISGRIETGGKLTNQAAEIAAAADALRQVRLAVEPARGSLLKSSTPQLSDDHYRDIKGFRLIVATDSSYIVECMTKHIQKWSIENGIYRTEQGNVVENSDGFTKLTYLVQDLSMAGIQVAWYYVPREFNEGANGLAQLAFLS